MDNDKAQVNQAWENFHGPNLGYVYELYDLYLKNPEEVDESVKAWFDQFGEPNQAIKKEQAEGGFDTTMLSKAAAARRLAENIRTYGHLAANIFPFGREETDISLMDPKEYQLNSSDLESLPAVLVWEDAPKSIKNGLEAVNQLKKIYTKTLAFEFSHVHDRQERKWLNQWVETKSFDSKRTTEERKDLLKRLVEVEGFERFLHKTFVGQKRFSIEGVDVLIPMLDELIKVALDHGTNSLMVGMAHRGRLNVLAHTLGKPYEKIFSEFHNSPNKELVPSEGSMGINYGWTGDVKYHLGGHRKLGDEESPVMHIKLANNPSHLEYVNPVVLGYTRAFQEDRSEKGFPKQDFNKSMGVIIHGDAAFPGEGIVTETLNLSGLDAYGTGGTVHIIANNLVGFTTDSRQARSTRYASDPAKGFEIPVIHVNADDPEACLDAMVLAYEYRSRFHKDILIDLIGYRRFGHNEMDDPEVTQPLLYKKINEHRTVKELYANRLIEDGVTSEEDNKAVDQQVEDTLRDHYENMTQKDREAKEIKLPDTVKEGLSTLETSVSMDKLKEINEALLEWPEGFNVYPKLAKILKRRESALEKDGVDWALAEALAFATILSDGKPIRLTGQDSERGTFAHRHLILHDYENNDIFSPLHRIPHARASFALHNSPLSESAVLGFEYGYNVEAPETLVLWEAQYGDFVNVAQPIIDQFISAGRAKWGQKSSLVMLLPHGYEGQGPEHSSGRLERFLTLAAEKNWTVANLTNAAQYFHILRRQAKITETEEARPLIIMTPKSLIRNPRITSPGTEFSEGQFNLVIKQPNLGKDPSKVKRVVLCSGKVAVDLSTKLENVNEDEYNDVHILRIEQLYPFPKEEITDFLKEFPNLKEVVWVQEEPKNMGSWSYVESRIRELVSKELDVNYIGRPERSSPATGKPDVHKEEQSRIVHEALQIDKRGNK